MNANSTNRYNIAEANIVSLKKIWDGARHNAFTDLVRFKDRWYVTFREGYGHVSPDGSVRVLRSDDGDDWQPVALFNSPDQDMRECKFAIMADGRLSLTGAAHNLDHPDKPRHNSYAWFTSDGEHWSERTLVAEPNVWLWSNKWHNGTGYGFGYSTVEPYFERLYSTKDGKRWDVLVKDLLTDGFPTETGVLFIEDDQMVALVRQDREPRKPKLGIAKPPYTQWTWRTVEKHAEAAKLIQLPDGRILVAARLHQPERVGLCWLKLDTGSLVELLTLPSGGDCSYAGMVLHDGQLWMSYYSSHEGGKSSIYLARIRIDDLSQ